RRSTGTLPPALDALGASGVKMCEVGRGHAAGRRMFEGREKASGWILVATAFVALIAFTGLLYIRGSTTPRPIPAAGGGPVRTASPAPARSPSPAASAIGQPPTGSASPRASFGGAVAGATGTARPTSAAPVSTEDPTPSPTRTPRATPKPTPKPTPRPTP